MQSHFMVSSLARRYGIKPRTISDLFYSRKLSDQACPIVDGRRIIPESYLPELEAVLREHGLLEAQEVVSLTAHPSDKCRFEFVGDSGRKER